jgi:hypothetical protein
MPAVRFEAKAFSDIRFAMLAQELGWHVHRVRGAMLEIWAHCTENNVETVKGRAVDILADAPGFSKAMLVCELADEVSPGVVRVRGAHERVGWLATKRDQLSKARENRRRRSSDDRTDVNVDDSVDVNVENRQTTELSSVCVQDSPHVDDSTVDSSVSGQSRITITRAVTRTEVSKKETQAFERAQWPLGLRDEQTEAALRAWFEYRRERKQPITTRTCSAILAEYVGRPADFCRDVNHSIARGYQGLFAPSGNGRNGRSNGEMNPNNLTAEDIRRIGDEAEARGL